MVYDTKTFDVVFQQSFFSLTVFRVGIGLGLGLGLELPQADASG